MTELEWIDTHCHLDAAEFEADRESQRQRARQLGVTTCVLPAVERTNWPTVTAWAQRHQDVYALGIHPLYVPRMGPDDLQALHHALQAQRDDPALVAVGEIGLDRFEGHPDLELQVQCLRAQLSLAQAFELPVILHVRRAVDLVLKELRRCPVRGGIAHAFNGSAQQAQMFIDLGFALGLGGALTYERSLRLRDLARELGVWFTQHAQSMDAALALHLRGVGYDPVSGRVLHPEALPTQEITGCGGSCSS